MSDFFMEPPQSKNKILQRIRSIISSRDNRLVLAKEMGINEDWVSGQYEQPLIFGPAEQANPFLTVYAYSKDPSLSPEALDRQLSNEMYLEDTLSQSGLPSNWSLLTLKHDSFSTTGATARYHFRGPTADPKHLLSYKERKKNSGRPFCEVTVDTKKILNSMKWVIQDSVSSGETSEQAVRAFVDDVSYAIEDSSKDDSTPIPYLEFCNSFNSRSISRFRSGRNTPVEFVDEGKLDDFVYNGVNSWPKFFNSLLTGGFASPDEAMFRLKLQTERGNRYVRLGLGGSPSGGGVVLSDVKSN